MGRRHLIAIAATIPLALGTAFAPTAAAQFEWSTPQEVSPAGQGAEVPQVAIANDGSALMVWRQDDGCRPRLWVAYRNRGGRFSAPEPFSTLGAGADNCASSVGNVGDFDLAMNARGDAVVVYEAASNSAGSTTNVLANYRSAGQRFNAFIPEGVSGSGNFVDPKAAIDGAGTPTAIYHGPPVAPGQGGLFNSESIYRSKVRGPSGSWGSTSADLLGHPDQSGEFFSSYNETGGTIASNDAGDRLAGRPGG